MQVIQVKTNNKNIDVEISNFYDVCNLCGGEVQGNVEISINEKYSQSHVTVCVDCLDDLSRQIKRIL